MTDELDVSEDTLDTENHDTPKPSIPPAKKVSRFGPQNTSKFGGNATKFSPPNKQRPGRAAGRGR